MCVDSIHRIQINWHNDSWLVKFYGESSDDAFVLSDGKTFDPNKDELLIVNLQDIFSEIDEGNAVAIYNGTIKHWAVCVGRNDDNEVMIMHRMPGETAAQQANYVSRTWSNIIKSIFESKGEIKREKLSDIINFSTLSQLEIFKCRSDVNENLCRAAAVHKADLARGTPRYNLLYENCENFASYCCSSYCLTTSFQIVELAYVIATVSISIGCFLICFFYLGLGFVNFFTSLCAPSLILLISQGEFCQVFVYSYVFTRNQRQQIAAVTRFAQGNDEKKITIYKKSEYIREKTAALELKLDQDITEDEIMFVENGILEDIYYLCQPFNHSSADVTELANSLGQLLEPYLALKISHVTLLMRDVLQHPANSRGVGDIFKQLGILLADLKAFTLGVSECERAEEISQLKARATEIIFILVGLFDPQKVDHDLWTEENIRYAQGLCKRIGILNIAFPFSGDDSVKEKIFKYLDRYWDCLFNVNFALNNAQDAVALLDEATDQFTKNECEDNDVKALLTLTCQFITDSYALHLDQSIDTNIFFN